MRTEQEIKNRLDSLYTDYGNIENTLSKVIYNPEEQSLSERLDFIKAEIETLEWILKC